MTTRGIQEEKYADQPLPHHVTGRIQAHIQFVNRCIADNAHLPPHGELRLLDVGCATGALLLGLPDIGHRSGVDISTEQIKIAMTEGLEARVCDLERDALPYEDETFDVVCAFDVIEHVLHTDHALNEMNRVLRPGGTFIGSVPNLYQPLTFLMMLRDLTPMYASRYRSLHVRDFTLRLFRGIVRKHGFRVTRCSGAFVFPFDEAGWSHKLADWFPRLGSLICVGTTKTETVLVPDGFSANINELLDFLRS